MFIIRGSDKLRQEFEKLFGVVRYHRQLQFGFDEEAGGSPNESATDNSNRAVDTT